MKLARAFRDATRDEIKAALAGGTLELFSTGRPPLADHPVTRSARLATFTFGDPAFAEDPAGGEGLAQPLFAEDAVQVALVGTPGFARARTRDGTVVADLSVGPGGAEIRLDQISATPGFPIRIVRFVLPHGGESTEFAVSAFGHAYVTGSDNPFRKISLRG